MLKAILFDLWETLIHDDRERGQARQTWRTENVRHAIAEQGLELPTEEVRAALDQSMRALTALQDTGVDVGPLGRTRIFAGELQRATGHDLPAAATEAVEAAITILVDEHAPSVAPGAVETLVACQARGLRTVLVSNAGFTTAPSLRWLLQHHGLRQHLDALVFSDEQELAKPHARMFSLALEAIGEAAADCVFVGDSPLNDVQGAQQAGMFAVQIGRREREGITPDLRIDSLVELLPALQAAGHLGVSTDALGITT